MKLRYTIFVVLGVLLSSSLFGAGIVTTQTSTANTNFATGDNFHFNTTETRNDNWSNKIVLANDTNPTQLYRYDERYEGNDETITGDLNLFLIKPDSNLPAFTNEDGAYDHIVIVDWEGETVDPSTRTSWDKIYDAGGECPTGWCNSTVRVEDTTGRHHSSRDNNNDDEEGDDNRWQPLVSNATYLVLMSEMTDNTVGFGGLEGWNQQFDMGSFDNNLQLISREVTDVPGRSYYVNDATRSIDTRMVRSTFGTAHSQTFPGSMYFGDSHDPQNDPDGWLAVDATVDITANYVYTYYFDTTTGMIVEIGEDSSYNIDLNYFIASTPNMHPGGGPSTYSLDYTFSMNSVGSSLQTIDEASSFYGKTRALSSDPNRITTGMKFVYDSESDNGFTFDTTTKVGNNTHGYEEQDSRNADSQGRGTITFDVYRHRPGAFETVMAMEGVSNGTYNWSGTRTEQGIPYSDSMTHIQPPRNYLDYDYMEFDSSDAEEIMHFFDENKHFEDDFLYDDDDDFRLNYDRELAKEGVVNHTIWHVDFDADELVTINGFDHTWFDVEMYGQRYEQVYDQFVQIPISRDDDGEAWITVKLTGKAKAEQNFYYDQATGVLVAMEERVSAELKLEGSGLINATFRFEGQPEIVNEVNADFKADIRYEERFFILLAEHPVEYKSAEAVDPVDHITDTPITSTSSETSSTTTTDTTDTTDTTSSSSSEDGGADLPLPVPIVPVIAALGIIVIYVRKRNF